MSGPACRLAVKVVPGASRDEVAGEFGDGIRIRLRAPPVEGRANAALLAFLAERLGLPRAAVSLVAGAGGRRKLVAISGLDEPAVRRRLMEGS